MTFPELLQRIHPSHARQPETWQAASLAEARPGQSVQVDGFLPGLSPERQAHLRAYGLTPGSRVEVIQQRPVIVVRVEQTELAMEDELARRVEVHAIE